MKTETLFSSASSEWETPQWLFDSLDSEFHFTLDAAASDQNHKCEKYYTVSDNALKRPWGRSTFVNPPFGRGVDKWVEKAAAECRGGGSTVVMLLPARTDTQWFHRWIYHRHEVRFMNGRIKFGGSKINAPFPTMIVIMRGESK